MDTTTLHGRCFEVTPNGVLIFETFLSCYQPCKKLFQTKSYWFDIDKYNHAGLILGIEKQDVKIFLYHADNDIRSDFTIMILIYTT